ncbi:MAG: dihydrodipicolinate synthase family protein, partial [Thermomicrobiales bacterium]
GVLLAGADGSVPGICNVDPHGFVKIYDAVKRGDIATAIAEQDRIYKLFSIINCAEPGRMGTTSGALGGFKTALQLRGIIDTNIPGRPMTRLNAAETARVRKVEVEAGLL